MKLQSLRTYAKRRLWAALWKNAPLHWRLPSSIEIVVASEADWVLYCSIFADGEYDFPIRRALDRVSERDRLTVLDLGANVGFFALRLLDVTTREGGPDAPVAAILVEGSGANVAELHRRLGLERRVRIAHGLVGARKGNAMIFEHSFHAINSVRNPILARTGIGTKVAYIDLAALTADISRIHLIKCDIEGSELEFLEAYPDLLARTDAIVLELHPDICNTARCRTLLSEAGLTRTRVIRDAADQSVEYFERGVGVGEGLS
jgi:FkbM family methyltransferase